MPEHSLLVRTISGRWESVGTSPESFAKGPFARHQPAPDRNGILWPRLGLGLVLGALILCTFLFLDAEKIEALARWLETHRSPSAIGIFMGIGVAAVVLLVPGPVIAVFGGALYGKVAGFGIVLASVAIGQSVAYVIGRFLLRDWVVEFASRRITRFPLIDSVVAREGWKFVLLLRLSPLLPDSVLNYVLAVTAISYHVYVVTSLVAVVPWTVGFVYVGSLAHNVAEAAHSGVRVSPTTLAVSMAVSVVALGLLGWLAARVSRRALAEALDDKRLSGDQHSA
ncbi:unnamed protein product [Ostreobium quekettii]|uniref:VTT domain-containing protein n=1 Tax=Ostreobium quekettii TaxID=121088 RepID=A0A8S1IVV8_9CHLO|nr:unnamed protein product [Ostreobium quekettii]|eukprot:evm.model.scf_397.9 EVM.evm.TU.scf_397.9   scf_397:76928-77773(-)